MYLYMFAWPDAVKLRIFINIWWSFLRLASSEYGDCTFASVALCIYVLKKCIYVNASTFLSRVRDWFYRSSCRLHRIIKAEFNRIYMYVYIWWVRRQFFFFFYLQCDNSFHLRQLRPNLIIFWPFYRTLLINYFHFTLKIFFTLNL